MSKKTVLLVDDDVDFLEVNRLALEKAGYTVVTAHDGSEGFTRAVEAPVDVAVLDVMMRTPDEGFDLARRLRKHQPTAKIPLLMLTSINAVNAKRGFPFRLSDADRDDLWLPVDKFIDKPVSATKLVTLVRELEG
ncbi:MAG TPA: response regulator [Polyangia bacterium]|jgi:CheY-like chemotaxis protein